MYRQYNEDQSGKMSGREREREEGYEEITFLKVIARDMKSIQRG